MKWINSTKKHHDRINGFIDEIMSMSSSLSSAFVDERVYVKNFRLIDGSFYIISELMYDVMKNKNIVVDFDRYLLTCYRSSAKCGIKESYSVIASELRTAVLTSHEKGKAFGLMSLFSERAMSNARLIAQYKNIEKMRPFVIIKGDNVVGFDYSGSVVFDKLKMRGLV